MKSVLFSLFLIASMLTPSAFAQEESDRPHWHVIHYGPDMLMTMDLHAGSRQDSLVTVEVAAYMPQTTKPAGDIEVDFISSLWQFDCAQANTVRTLQVKGFVANVGPATFEEENAQSPWRTVAHNTASSEAWIAACKGVSGDTAVYDITTHEQVLTKYRNSFD